MFGLAGRRKITCSDRRPLGTARRLQTNPPEPSPQLNIVSWLSALPLAAWHVGESHVQCSKSTIRACRPLQCATSTAAATAAARRRLHSRLPPGSLLPPTPAGPSGAAAGQPAGAAHAPLLRLRLPGGGVRPLRTLPPRLLPRLRSRHAALPHVSTTAMGGKSAWFGMEVPGAHGCPLGTAVQCCACRCVDGLQHAALSPFLNPCCWPLSLPCWPPSSLHLAIIADTPLFRRLAATPAAAAAVR